MSSSVGHRVGRGCDDDSVDGLAGVSQGWNARDAMHLVARRVDADEPSREAGGEQVGDGCVAVRAGAVGGADDGDGRRREESVELHRVASAEHGVDAAPLEGCARRSAAGSRWCPPRCGRRAARARSARPRWFACSRARQRSAPSGRRSGWRLRSRTAWPWMLCRGSAWGPRPDSFSRATSKTIDVRRQHRLRSRRAGTRRLGGR